MKKKNQATRNSAGSEKQKIMNMTSGNIAGEALETTKLQSPPDLEIEESKKVSNWIAVASTTGGEHRIYNKNQYIPSIRAGIIDGIFTENSLVAIHTRGEDGKWNKISKPLAEIVNGHFKLRALYEPVWSHALEGLKWGALAGIGLKFLDTLVTLGSVDPTLAILFLAAIGACLIPRIGLIGMVIISIAMSRYSQMNIFMVVISAALAGATLGCLPGMAVGGVVGVCRRKSYPQAADAKPERDGLVFKAVLFPLLGGAAVWALYLFVFNPWVVGLLTKQSAQN
jgi:hypothetical protein